MSFIRRMFVFGVALFAAAAGTFAQDPPKQDPAKQDPPAEEKPKQDEFEATLVEIKGTVDVKRPEDKDWGAATRNMKLGKGSEICTGSSSSAKLVFAKGLTVDLRPVTMASLVHLWKKAQSLTVDTTIKFGSAEIKLEKSEVQADMKVATPAVTTSISGSHGTIRGWAMAGEHSISLRVFEGRWGRNHGGGIGQTGNPGDSLNDLGSLPADIDYAVLIETLKLLGRTDDELGGKWSEFLFGLNPPHEGGNSNTNPFQEGQQYTAKPTLPAPPGPP